MDHENIDIPEILAVGASQSPVTDLLYSSSNEDVWHRLEDLGNFVVELLRFGASDPADELPHLL